jgi:hypothetical protein
MGHCHAGYSAQILYSRNGGIIDQADAIPQDVTIRGLHKQGALSDGKFRSRDDSGQPRFKRPDYVVMS